MVGYRCYILDGDGHIVQAHDLDCDTDTQARWAAEGLLACDPYHRAAEIWRATKRVVTLQRDAVPRMRLARRLAHPARVLGSLS